MQDALHVLAYLKHALGHCLLFFFLLACIIEFVFNPGRGLLQTHASPKYQPVPGG